MTNQDRSIFKMGAAVVGFVAFLIMCFMAIGINDLGYRTVVQWPSGKTFVKFDRGIYVQAFGTEDTYPDVVVFDFDRSDSEGNEILDQKGIGVRYQDGGLGAVYGKSRVNLPTDEDMMLKIHKEFHSVRGLANNLIKPVTEEGMNLTAGLMNSEEAYATKRAIFTNMAKDQIGKGKYKTYLKEITTTDPATGKTVKKEIPDIVLSETNQPVHYESDFKHYGLVLASIQLNDPGFEASTKTQIAKKREATMAIITAKANAEKAKQDAITAEEKGKADVMTARYAKEVIKAEAVVDAKRKKEVAEIDAEQKVAVAKQSKLEAVQMKLKAKEIKQEQILLGQGEAERKRLVLAADGALAQKLEAAIIMNRDAMNALAKRGVPQTYIAGGTGGGKGGAGYDAEMVRQLQLMNINTVKALNLNTKVK